MKTTDNNATQTELECQAAAFRRLVSHLQMDYGEHHYGMGTAFAVTCRNMV